MKLKKYSEFTKLTDATLEQEIHSSKEKLSSLRFEHKVKGLANPSTIPHLRREIAQMNTEMTKRKNIKNS